MLELEIYNLLNEMVIAAEADEREKVIEINREFSSLSSKIENHFRSLPIEEQPTDWYEKEIMTYDRVRNLACYSITNYIQRESLLEEMRDKFSKIPKPE